MHYGSRYLEAVDITTVTDKQSYRYRRALALAVYYRYSAMQGEDETKRGGEAADSPLLAYLVFIKMEEVMDKLKLLNYEQKFCKKFKLKPCSK